MNDQHDDADHQQDVNQAARDVESEQAERPQNDDDDGERQKHGAFLLLYGWPRNGRTAEAFRRKGLNQPALLQRSLDEAGEERMRLERAALQLGVKLDANEPRMVRPLDNLRQLVVRRHAREQQTGAFQ